MEKIRKVIEFAQKCHYGQDHAHQVTRLALKLFDELRDLHGLGMKEKLWLKTAALLHDIGWMHGQKGHHKAARDLIIASDLPFLPEEKTVIALIARYHRKALPEDTHKYFCDLSPEMKKSVRVLASLLRIADGLDRMQEGRVKDFHAEMLGEDVKIELRSSLDLHEEMMAALEKSDLFEKTFGKKILFDQRDSA